MEINSDIKSVIAQQIAIAVDGQLNDWQDFKTEALAVHSAVAEQIKYALTATSESEFREKVMELFEISTPRKLLSSNDSQSTFCTSSQRSISFRRRTVRRRSSAC